MQFGSIEPHNGLYIREQKDGPHTAVCTASGMIFDVFDNRVQAEVAIAMQNAAESVQMRGPWPELGVVR